MTVLDASAAVEWLGGTEAGEHVARLALRGWPLHVPHLFDIEVTSALRRQCFLAAMTPERAREAVGDLRTMPVKRHPHTPLLDRIWDFRHEFTAYDAAYLALTEALDATLLTRDAALKSARLKRGRVTVV